jgi:APA family basic amino acid/polyamine antiporter
MALPPAVASDARVLERRLGAFDAAAIVVSNVIGGGILFTPPLVAAGVPHPWVFLATWVAGGVLALAGAMAYAELAALRPHAGGEYVYLRAAYGRFAAFLTGWTSFVAGFAGAIAASATVLVLYLDRFVPGVADPSPLFAVPIPFVPLAVSRRSVAAIGVIMLFAFVHVRGVGPGRLVTNWLTTLKVLGLLAFIALGLSRGAGSTAYFFQPAGPVVPATWILALLPVMFTYAGWNAATYVAEEIERPSRNIPLALVIGTVGVTVVYLLLNVLYLYVMPVGELATVRGSVLDVVADRLLGKSAGSIMGAISIVSLAAGVNAYTFVGPRVYYAMARDGLFFQAAARVHPRFKTPALSVVAQALWSSVLVLTGSLDALTNYVGFIVTLFSGLAAAAIFVLRAREPQASRPFSALGYPLTPAIFVGVSAVMVANAVYRDPGGSRAGVLVVAAGIPFYWWFRSRAAHRLRPAVEPSENSERRHSIN